MRICRRKMEKEGLTVHRYATTQLAKNHRGYTFEYFDAQKENLRDGELNPDLARDKRSF